MEEARGREEGEADGFFRRKLMSSPISACKNKFSKLPVMDINDTDTCTYTNGASPSERSVGNVKPTCLIPCLLKLVKVMSLVKQFIGKLREKSKRKQKHFVRSAKIERELFVDVV